MSRLERADFHDDAVLAVRIVPAQSFRQRARVEFDLAEYGSVRPRTLIFRGCENIRLNVDFSVLTDNAFGVVDQIVATRDIAAIRLLLEAQGDRLNVTYEDQEGSAIECPRREAKLTDPASLILFSVMLYGGTIEIVARDFVVKRASNERIEQNAMQR